MRKYFLPMMFVLALMSSLSMKSSPRSGDVNEDGMVNITDVTTLIDYLSGGQMDEDVSVSNGDVNDDGLVNIADATVLIDYILLKQWIGVSKTVTVNGVSFKMIFVDGGTFVMGSKDTTLTSLHYPPHEVTLSSFYMGQTEVTQALWTAVMGSNPSNTKGADLPVENMTWADQVQFVAQLNAMTGLSFSIPTEAQWEFAARGGNLGCGYDYSGGNDLDEIAWYSGNSGRKTHPVATKKANELGLYDMTGNVYERVSDYYAPYTTKPQTNPTGPATAPDPSLGSSRLNRGGGAQAGNWGNYHVWLRCRQSEDFKGPFDGLRIVLSATEAL